MSKKINVKIPKFAVAADFNPVQSSHNHNTLGMSRVQFVILIGLVMLIAALSLPPWLQFRKVSQADGDVEEIAIAIQKYHRYTGEYPKTLENLIADPGIEGWRASFPRIPSRNSLGRRLPTAF